MPLIIVVDDRPAKRREYLNMAAEIRPDVTVEGFANPQSALDGCTDEAPDLVIIGRTLPTLNAVRAIRRFRKLPNCETLPVIVMIEPDDRRLLFRALEAGASEVFVVPPDPAEYELRARNLLAAREINRNLQMRAKLLERGLAAKDRRYRRDLHATRSSLRGIVDTIPAMVSVSDRGGNYVFVNQFMAGFYGKRPDETLGMSVQELLGPVQGKRELAADREVFRGAGTLLGYEEEICDASGMPRTFLSTKSALRDENRRIVNVITVSQDITFRKWVEAELREAKQAAEAASRVKTEFLANVSHELRTPLNAIIGFAEGMGGDFFGQPDFDRYRQYTDHISESARHLKSIVDDILDIASIEAGRLELLEHVADPAAIAWETVRDLEKQAAQEQVSLSVERGEVPLPLDTDPDRLRQILKNLLSNAIKFSPEGGEVRISVSQRADGGVQIAVRDSGSGIAAEDLPLATDRFGQLVGDPMCNPVGGMGLGLPLAISLAELLGARVEIDSLKGEGTTVSLVFPEEKRVRPNLMAG